MTQTQFDLSELLEAIRAGGDIDFAMRWTDKLFTNSPPRN